MKVNLDKTRQAAYIYFQQIKIISLYNFFHNPYTYPWSYCRHVQNRLCVRHPCLLSCPQNQCWISQNIHSRLRWSNQNTSFLNSCSAGNYIWRQPLADLNSGRLKAIHIIKETWGTSWTNNKSVQRTEGAMFKYIVPGQPKPKPVNSFCGKPKFIK